MSPKVYNPLRKFIVNTQLIISHSPTFFRNFIYRMDIKKLLISMVETDTNPTERFHFRPFHRSFPHSPRQELIQFFGYRSIEYPLISIRHRTGIPKKLIRHRFLPTVHHIIGSQTESMQGILASLFQRKLNGKIVDACRQVGRLKTHILHLLTGNPLKRFTQRPVTMTQRMPCICTKRP